MVVVIVLPEFSPHSPYLLSRREKRVRESPQRFSRQALAVLAKLVTADARLSACRELVQVI